MKPEKQTREKLLKAAKEEFLEKGYMAASLRNICRKADVTTGALYFFFKDKGDLFGSLVRDTRDRFYNLMKNHYENELKEIDKLLLVTSDMSDDWAASMGTVELLFEHYDETVLLLMKSQGSEFENCLDDFVSISEKHYRILADRMAEIYNKPTIDDYTIHWIAHIQISSFAQIVTHGLSKEEAVMHMKKMIVFLINGWFGLFGQNWTLEEENRQPENAIK